LTGLLALRHLIRKQITKVEKMTYKGSVKYEIESEENGPGKDVTISVISTSSRLPCNAPCFDILSIPVLI
jgi:hypothetical protein